MKSATIILNQTRRVVTGLTLTNDGTISIGRERKKLIRAMIHHYEKGLLDAENLRKLVGLLAFANDAEPAFVLRMKLKYGEKLMAEILDLS